MDLKTFEGWSHLYTEVAEIIKTKIPEVEWIDLWHNQVGFLVDELPFPTPALFLSFRMPSADNLAQLVQDSNVQVDMYYFYETFHDTNVGAYNQESALDFLKLTTELHKTFHGTTGKNYREMIKIGFAPVDTGSAGNLYKISFSCKVLDDTAKPRMEQVSVNDITVKANNIDRQPPTNDFMID